MATKKAVESKPEGIPMDEPKPKARASSSTASELDKVIAELQKLSELSNPKSLRHKTLADILSLANSAATKSVGMLEDIKKKL